MFRNRFSILYRVVYYLLFVIVFLKQARTLLAPWLGSEEAFTFRSDNFYSFSGGQIRRGLIGELLIALQSIGLPAILLYSLLLLVTYAFFYLWIFPRLVLTFKRSEYLLILLSGLFLMPGIDREIFMLIPAVYYFFYRRMDTGFYLLLALIAFVHELSLLLYFPFILSLFQKTIKEFKFSSFGTLLLVIASYAAVLLFSGKLNLSPELDFWPRYGIQGIQDHYLYEFTGMKLLDALHLHAAYMWTFPRTKFALIGLAAYFVVVLLSFKRLGASPLLTAFYLLTNFVIFVLTIDHGRYFYLLFFFYLLLLSTGLLKEAEQAIKPFERFMPKFIERWLSFDYKSNYYLVAMVIFALAPFGYYAGGTQYTPAIWQEIEQLIHFELPEHATV